MMEPLGNFAFNFNLRRYNQAKKKIYPAIFALFYDNQLPKAGRCRLTVSKLVLNAPMVSALEATICCSTFELRFQFQVAPLHQGVCGVRVCTQQDDHRGRARPDSVC